MQRIKFIQTALIVAPVVGIVPVAFAEIAKNNIAVGESFVVKPGMDRLSNQLSTEV